VGLVALNATLASATIRSSIGLLTADMLNFTNQGGISGTFSDDTPIRTRTASLGRRWLHDPNPDPERGGPSGPRAGKRRAAAQWDGRDRGGAESQRHGLNDDPRAAAAAWSRGIVVAWMTNEEPNLLPAGSPKQ